MARAPRVVFIFLILLISHSCYSLLLKAHEIVRSFRSRGFSSMHMESLKTADVFSLESIRSTLIRQEETIIFALIERAQYRANHVIYDKNTFTFKSSSGEPLSFLEWMLIETEKLHSKVRRYTSPEEHAFFPSQLDEPILPTLTFPEILLSCKDKVNVNSEVMKLYVNKIVQDLCIQGDDEQYGSSVLCDINAMQVNRLPLILLLKLTSIITHFSYI
jgi:chorismate mutase